MKTYPLFPTRRAELLDGFWDFTWLGDDADIDGLDIGSIVYRRPTAVPGVFDTGHDLFGRRGVGVYRRFVSLVTEPGTRLRLHIGGMGLFARIWWDGNLLADYRTPYSTVDIDLTAEAGTVHELVIAVDNRFDPDRVPLFAPKFDFYGYGGIYRSIEVQELPRCYLERVQVTTENLETGQVRLRVRLGGNVPDKLNINVAFDDERPVEIQAAVKDDEIVLFRTVPDHRIWSPENPALHTVTVSILDDTIIERFGIRTVETSGRDIVLNGEPVRLFGLNRHESHPEFGPVQPAHLMADDIDLLKDLGSNFIRCVHYPQDQVFLDLCDQAGILVWQESLGWNDSEERARNPEFFELQVEQTRLMVRNSINHPAVILWGFLNECCSDTEGGKILYRALAQTIRAEDPKLLVTWASSKREKDICFELADVVSINVYPGWFSHIKDWHKPSSAWIEACMEEYASGLGNRTDVTDKPMIVSEIGCCGLYGCHDRAHAQWSEEYQADYFAEACRCILDNPRYAGIALWQLIDTRSYVNAGTDVRGKPRGFNCAGVVDEYRRPKLAYDAVREAFRSRRPE